MGGFKDGVMSIGDLLSDAQERSRNGLISEAQRDGVVTRAEREAIDRATEQLNGLNMVNNQFNSPMSEVDGTQDFPVDYGWGEDDLSGHQPSSMRPDGFAGRTRPGFEYNALSALAETAHSYKEMTAGAYSSFVATHDHNQDERAVGATNNLGQGTPEDRSATPSSDSLDGALGGINGSGHVDTSSFGGNAGTPPSGPAGATDALGTGTPADRGVYGGGGYGGDGGGGHGGANSGSSGGQTGGMGCAGIVVQLLSTTSPLFGLRALRVYLSSYRPAP